MKKNILFIFLFLLFPLSVYADSIELRCQNGDNKQIICEINGNSEKTIKEIEFSLITSKNVVTTNINIGHGWKAISKSGDITITHSGATNKFQIGEVSFEHLNEEEGYIGIEDIKYKDSSNNIINVENITRTVPIIEDDSRLKYIIIDNYLIDFKPNTLEYTINIKKEDSLNITAIPEYEDTKYTIIGNHDLKNDSEIEIITNSSDQMSTTYKIKINKEEKASNEKIFYIFIGVVAVIVIINIARLINARKK